MNKTAAMIPTIHCTRLIPGFMNHHALAMELAAELAKHVPADHYLLCFARRSLAIPTTGQFKRGEDNPAAVLTPDDVRRMRAMHRDGMSYGQLAIRYGMSKRQIRRICAREQWSWVND
jgi:hypothetical protein